MFLHKGELFASNVNDDHTCKDDAHLVLNVALNSVYVMKLIYYGPFYIGRICWGIPRGIILLISWAFVLKEFAEKVFLPLTGNKRTVWLIKMEKLP